MAKTTTNRLKFVRYDTSDLESISALFVGEPPASRCGIYILHFDDGMQYVGQAGNVVTRFGAHRRRWPGIVALQFAQAPATQLDALERATIKRLDKDGVPLRNKLLTGRPGGVESFAIDTRAGETISLPLDRDERQRPRGAQATRPMGKYLALAGEDFYLDLLLALGEYVYQTIPAPERTAGLTWFVSPLPATGWGNRLVTFSCGPVETLFVSMYVDAGMVFCLNLSSDISQRKVKALGSRWGGCLLHTRRGPYRSAATTCVEIKSHEAFTEFIQVPEIAQAAYALNVRMMRTGSRLQARHHNTALASDITWAGGIAADYRS